MTKNDLYSKSLDARQVNAEWSCVVKSTSAFRWLRAWSAPAAIILWSTAVAAQSTGGAGWAHLSANSETERYFRVLQLTGVTPSSQWTIRPFGPMERETWTISGDHPWRAQQRGLEASARAGLTPQTLSLAGNSSFPYGFNDGPMWAGKGVTMALQGGAFAKRGGFFLQAEPMVFMAQNADFAIASNGFTDARRYGDWSTPGLIDEPQRFGTRAYARADAGESQLRYDGHGLSLGASTTAEFWGPATEHPIILGNNAGGIPRLFLGTARPVGFKGIRVHGRVIWGRLDQSDYAADSTVSPHFATAIVGVMTLGFVPGLELGAGRFFHAPWPANGWWHAPWTRSLQVFFRGPLARGDDPSFGANPDNQLASAFMRWAPPGAGVEAYVEYGREDRNGEWQDLLQEPDHDRAYLLGFTRTWKRADNRIVGLRGELLNSRITHLAPARVQTQWYVHSSISSGHTQQGQVLGSAGGHGGGAAVVALDWYSPVGRTTVRWDRLVQATALTSSGLPVPQQSDVIHALGLERARFTQFGFVATRVAVMKEFNRYFGRDAFNANVAVSFQRR
jgi:hypothetical protein